MWGYRIDIEPDDNGTFLVTCRAIPELTTYGEDREQAIKNACDALDEALAARIAAGQTIPDPDGANDDAAGVAAYATLRLQTALKVELYQALQATGTTRAELGRRLNWHREQVDRLFRLDHASRLDQIEAAAGSLGFVIDTRLVHPNAA